MPLSSSIIIEYQPITGDPFRKGTQSRIKLRVLGRTIEATSEVVESLVCEHWPGTEQIKKRLRNNPRAMVIEILPNQ